ncbi:MAG: TolC family protein [Bacteroidales bacterium]|nr:TolC family protein [Bacteroidales bacterium]
MKRFISVVALTALGLSSAYAQPDLEQCKEMARKHYPAIRQYDLISQSQDYNMSNVSKAWLPQVSLSAQATYQSDVARWPDQFESMLAAQGLDMPGLRQDQYKVQIDIQQTIWDGGKSKAEKTLTESETQQSLRAADVEMYALDKRIVNLYFGILLLQEQKRQVEDMIARLQNNLDYVNALVDNGVAMQADADAVEAQMLSSGQTLHQIKSSEESFRKMLELFIGDSLGTGSLSLPQTHQLMIAESQRPELMLFDSQIKTLEAKNQMLNVALTPKFALFAQGYYGYPGLNMFENMMSSRWSLNGIVGIRMSWNISSFYTDKTSRKQIQNAIDRVKMQKDIFSFNNRLQAEQDDAEIRRIKAVLADDDRIVRLRQNVREAAEARLQEGAIDMNDLLTKISDESAAMIARSTHEIELVKAIYDLKYTLNR